MTPAAPPSASSPIAFPWDEAMRAGLGLLRLAPRDFWSMTPRELAAALDGRMGRGQAAEALSRTGLAELMHRFPDRNEGSSDA